MVASDKDIIFQTIDIKMTLKSKVSFKNNKVKNSKKQGTELYLNGRNSKSET